MDTINQIDPPVISGDMLAPERTDAFPKQPVFENGMSAFPTIPIIIILLCGVVFVLQVAVGSLESEEGIIRVGALVRDLVVNGELWRLVSSMFLHASASHIIGNMVALYILGMAVQHAFGAWRTMYLYFLSGIVAAIGSVILNAGPSVGASGAVFGLMGAMVAYFAFYKKEYRFQDNRIGAVLLVWAIYSFVEGMATPYIDVAAHIFGFAAGFLLAYLVKPRLKVSGG